MPQTRVIMIEINMEWNKGLGIIGTGATNHRWKVDSSNRICTSYDSAFSSYRCPFRHILYCTSVRTCMYQTLLYTVTPVRCGAGSDCNLNLARAAVCLLLSHAILRAVY